MKYIYIYRVRPKGVYVDQTFTFFKNIDANNDGGSQNATSHKSYAALSAGLGVFCLAFAGVLEVC